eukprot:snap_masked-scaffold_8-processed-gene-8.58-mRNA-1 protein AED:1.00 eAED:1.00 QI:0/0/0/0/1/1/4/0/78
MIQQAISRKQVCAINELWYPADLKLSFKAVNTIFWLRLTFKRYLVYLENYGDYSEYKLTDAKKSILNPIGMHVDRPNS